MKQIHQAFTLIELLVVVAVIAVLMGILLPMLRRAREQAKQRVCMSDMRQIGIAISIYESSTNFDFRSSNQWDYKNGTADTAMEWQPDFAKAIMDGRFLPNRKAFFCPGVRNLSHKRNYPFKNLVAGDVLSYDTEYIERTFDDHPAFWSTHNWIWKKKETPATPSVNPISQDALLIDMSQGAWLKLDKWLGIGPIIEKLAIMQMVKHYNVLMKDLSVLNPANEDREINLWLWNQEFWPGTTQ